MSDSSRITASAGAIRLRRFFDLFRAGICGFPAGISLLSGNTLVIYRGFVYNGGMIRTERQTERNECECRKKGYNGSSEKRR